jgi:nucleoside-diphosphate-sugar epimerase
VRAVCYTLAGVDPLPSAGELADAIRAEYPGARIGFRPDAFAMDFHGKLQGRTFDESAARTELGWKPAYDLRGMIRDFGHELSDRPERYGKPQS